MLFWTSAAQVAAKMETMRSAEANLISFARKYGGRESSLYEMDLFDTEIPPMVLPLRKQPENDNDLVMHGIRITNKDNTDGVPRASTPLVLLHGYMNGALYFYRNIVGLTRYYQDVFSLDMMGWGLSSRPEFSLTDDSVETAEDFFVESLEAWRSKNKIEKMTLAGHSIGGYLSVAYCERYPERVERLILLSPVGVPERDEEESKKRLKGVLRSIPRTMLFNTFVFLFEAGFNPAKMLRTVPENLSRQWISSYVENRLPAISQDDERSALSDYLHTNSTLPGSGEYGLNRLLTPHAFAKKPTIHRIPQLKVAHVSFLYGVNDWMDFSGGSLVEDACQSRRNNGQGAPEIDVYKIRDAGHLLMLDNWEEFNSGVIVAGGGKDTLSQNAPLPTKISISTMQNEGVEVPLSEESRRQTIQVQA